MVDLHSHTLFSDGHCTHEEMIASAADRGVTFYGITDHLCFHENRWTTSVDRYDELKSKMAILKGEVVHPHLLFGMEVDYVPGCLDKVNGLKGFFNWDYIIGSVHYIGDWNIDSNPEDWVGRDVDKAYGDYYHLVVEMVDSGLYNIVGHLDLPKKYGHYSSLDFTSKIDVIGRLIVQKGMAYEINTAGRIKPCNEFYPSASIVKQLFDLGADVTLGSDAHHSNNVAQYFDDAIRLLKDVGYSKICYFKKGVKCYLSIDEL